MAERAHLSIGEVLNRLQSEFPGVTISKIRFLESQGLIDPERTESGYRKFKDADVKRLRWILHQQRDHFLPLKVIKERLLVTIALEAARTMEEGIVTDPREADIGSILGFGFAPYTGGTLSYIDGMGVKTFVDLCEKLAGKYGSHFQPTALLKDMAAKGETFYGRFAPEARKAA